MIDNNFVDAVIQLPSDLFFGTSIATCILVLKKNKSDNNILFVDASEEFVRNTNKNKLSDEQKEIFKTTETFFNKPYSKDKKGRSYLEYIEKNVGKDYYLEKGQYKENSLDLYESFDFNARKKYYYLATLTKEQPLNEDALIYECNNGEEVTQIKKLLKTVYLGAIFLLSLILINLLKLTLPLVSISTLTSSSISGITSTAANEVCRLF